MTAGNDLPIRRLLDVGRALVSDLDSGTILERVLEAARDVTGARYAALAVLDEERREVAQFLSSGLDQATHKAIGELPRGRGVLGVLIDDPRPLRLRDVSTHPQSYGFPPEHPTMRSFLGVPILVRDEPWGRLYLTEKHDAAEFTEADEEAVVILSEWAGATIDNARLYERSERRRAGLELAVRSLESARDIANAIGSGADLESVLELIVKRGRALVGARTVLIMLLEADELVLAASAGHELTKADLRLPVVGSIPGQVLERGRPQRIADVSSRFALTALGSAGSHSGLVVPMIQRGVGIGVLAAFDRGEEGDPFSETDERLLQTFAASASNAVRIARSVEADRLRSAMAAADAERQRWARELHDDTLQVFGALRILLSGVLRREQTDRYELAIREAVEELEGGIEGLRAIINDLRPASLDDLGLKPALEALIDRRQRHGLTISAALEIRDQSVQGRGLDPALETTIYRLVQESLTNVIKHANASTVNVRVSQTDPQITIEVEDDGSGFEQNRSTEGFGLRGMRERTYLAGGTFELDSSEAGTRLRIALPIRSAARLELAD